MEDRPVYERPLDERIRHAQERIGAATRRRYTQPTNFNSYNQAEELSGYKEIFGLTADWCISQLSNGLKPEAWITLRLATELLLIRREPYFPKDVGVYRSRIRAIEKERRISQQPQT